MKKFFKKFGVYIFAFLVIFFGTSILMNWFQNHAIAPNPSNWGTSAAIALISVMLYFVFKVVKNIDKVGSGGDKAKDEAHDKEGNKVSKFFNTDFITDKEFKENKAFNYNTLATIRQSKKDGVLVRANIEGRHADINFVEPIHTLIVGTTSSGKTWGYVVPSIQMLSMTAAKPSFVVTDPKGELYDNNYNKLTKEGYTVHKVDLINPTQSVRWNPLSYPYDMYHRSFNLEKEVRVHTPGDNPKKYNLIIQREFNYNETSWFEFSGTAYSDKESLEKDLRVISRELRDKVFTAVQDVCQAICPVQGDKDPSWQETAQKLLQAVIFAMLEDSRIPELNLTREKFNFYNVSKIVNTQDSGRDTFATLKQYVFGYRDKYSQIAQLANTALNNADTTTKNYVGFATAAMAMFGDLGISFLTSETEIDFSTMDEKPTALFLLIPDEIKARHPLAVLFVIQLYKRLVEKARVLGEKLNRHVYFLLDEFGNMPKFPNFGNLMTVGRSRGIYFQLCVQSYQQLNQVYGADEGKIIKDNCPIKVYIATEDMETNKEFSELLGKKTVTTVNEQTSIGPDGKKSTTKSTSTESIPIAYPEQLMKYRDKEEIIIKTFTPNAALKTKITRAYKCPDVYDLTKVRGGYIQRRTINEEAIYYDIKQRNKIMAQKNGDDDDDDDLF